MMMSTFLWCYNILCLLSWGQWSQGKSSALASVSVPSISSLHTKCMLLEVHKLFQEFICICDVRPFPGDSCHPSVTKATFWLLNRTMGTHRRISPAWKAQFKMRKPTRASTQVITALRKVFKNLKQIPNFSLTLIGFYTNVHRVHLSVWIHVLLSLG